MQVLNLTPSGSGRIYQAVPGGALPPEALTGWGVVLNLRDEKSAAPEDLARCRLRAGPSEVLPLILPPLTGNLAPAILQEIISWDKPLLVFAGSIAGDKTPLLEAGLALIDGLEAAAARRVRDGDWLVVTAAAPGSPGGTSCQVLALRGVRPPWFEVEAVDEGVYAITEPGHHEFVRSFLVLGSDEAALIDTGMGIDDMRPLVENLTDLPIRVLLTHAHWDHIGSVHRFERVAIHPAEKEALAQGAPTGSERLASLKGQLRTKYFGRPRPPYFDPDRYQIPGFPNAGSIEEGDEIDLGGRTLRVLHTPGHSEGSVSLLDVANRQLFIGDTFYYGPLYCADFTTYLETTRRLAALADQVDRVFSSHNELALAGRPMSGQDLRNLRDGFERIAQEKVAARARPVYDIPEGHFSVLDGFPY